MTIINILNGKKNTKYLHFTPAHLPAQPISNKNQTCTCAMCKSGNLRTSRSEVV